MQTFLPYQNFLLTAQILDKKRLWKQAVENLHIIGTILGLPNSKGKPRTGYKNHPAILMWKNSPKTLIYYHAAILAECYNRGIKTTLPIPNLGINGKHEYAFYDLTGSVNFQEVVDIEHPSFIGNTEFHRSHQSNLLRKDFGYYSKFFKDVPNDLPYLWPTK